MTKKNFIKKSYNFTKTDSQNIQSLKKKLALRTESEVIRFSLNFTEKFVGEKGVFA